MAQLRVQSHGIATQRQSSYGPSPPISISYDPSVFADDYTKTPSSQSSDSSQGTSSQLSQNVHNQSNPPKFSADCEDFLFSLECFIDLASHHEDHKDFISQNRFTTVMEECMKAIEARVDDLLSNNNAEQINSNKWRENKIQESYAELAAVWSRRKEEIAANTCILEDEERTYLKSLEMAKEEIEKNEYSFESEQLCAEAYCTAIRQKLANEGLYILSTEALQYITVVLGCITCSHCKPESIQKATNNIPKILHSASGADNLQISMKDGLEYFKLMLEHLNHTDGRSLRNRILEKMTPDRSGNHTFKINTRVTICSESYSIDTALI